jgi:hypothetical protein
LALAEIADPAWTDPIVQRAEVAHRRCELAAQPDEADEWADIGLNHAARALAIDANDPTALAIRGTLRYASWYYGPEPEPAEGGSRG